jgi:fructuronate reductase
VTIRTDAPAPLTRDADGAHTPAPVRIVHLGLGAFHRAHQAWYTDAVNDGVADDERWGIAAFTGRSPEAARLLGAQGGLYTVVERGEHGDAFHVVESIVEVHDGADLARLDALVASPQTAIVTVTVTEAAYLLGADGELDASSPAVVADLEPGAAPRSMPGRLARALAARRAAGAGPIAVVSCDNLPANGTAARTAVVGLARLLDPALAEWIDDSVSFVDTSVDRITPRAADGDGDAVARATGRLDLAPVVTEPFSSWVLSGDFPAGRPLWERAGAVFVDDIEPFERRKLWLLNGAHSLLAYAGATRGHSTVVEAVSDPVCAGWVEEFWNEAARHLDAPGLDIPAYRAALLDRFGNSRIAHHLAQIAADGSTKLRLRALPVLRAERAAGREGRASARLIAAWIDWTSTAEATAEAIADGRADDIAAAPAEPGHARTRALLAILDESLAADDAVVALVDSMRPDDPNTSIRFTEGNHP